MSFETDLFISYAHIDNAPLLPDEKGWISRFHASLQTFVNMRMGRRVEIWRDDKLQGNDVFSKEIVDQFPKTALFISVLTPRYIVSEWCTKEISEFCRTAEQNGGSVVDNKSRVFKVIKTPVDSLEPLPSVAKKAVGYEFYTREGNTPLELDPAYGREFAQAYNRKVVTLASEITETLKKLKTGGESEDLVEGRAATKATVYLAECSHDRRDDRERIEAELKAHGYTVLPDEQLPTDEASYIRAVERSLAKCRHSIHLVGDSYGLVPDGPSNKSVVVLQNELAAKRSKSDGLLRIISLPEGTVSEQARQQDYVETLNQNAEMQLGADLITGDLEHLKRAIHATLKKLEAHLEEDHNQHIAAEDGTKLIYLICDNKDRKATVPVRKYLKAQGLQVAIPAFEGDATEVREANRKLLTTCDGVLLFYGAGNEAWKRTVDNELKKMSGYRGKKPLLVSYTYLAEPKTSDKEDLIEMEEPNLANGLSGFSESVLSEFIEIANPGVTS